MAHHDHSCHQDHNHPFKIDYLFTICLILVIGGYAGYFFASDRLSGGILTFAHSAYDLINQMWWGLAVGFLFISALSVTPKEVVISMIGRPQTKSGLIKATLAGVLLDLCSHGILLVGMRLYERGAGLGQVMAFIIASPWNSFSLTLILIALIGLKWTLLFIILSMFIALISGYIFDRLILKGVLPPNPNQIEMPDHVDYKELYKNIIPRNEPVIPFILKTLKAGLVESKMVLRWILLGVVLAGLIRSFISLNLFQSLFAPTLAGLGLTMVFATILEICSEGSTPIAADILTRAKAPGNAFGFLMGGVATDYTEVMVLREFTKSWKIALFLPLVTLPQVLIISILINYFA